MGKTTKILLVDDDNDLVESTVLLLESHNYQVMSAGDGKSGFQKAREIKPDLMILDVMMTTKTEGFDVARKIAADPDLRDMPVILLTGIRREMELPYGFEPDEDWLPVYTVLEKPLEPDKLISKIEELLQQKREQ
ncbi:MAG: response regulator [Verrucomicrobiota bacterium]